MKNSENQIEQILLALDGIKRAQAPGDFELHLMSRLRFVTRANRWLKYCAAALIIFGLFNVFTLFKVETEPSETADPEYFLSSAAPVLNFTEDE